MAALLADFLGAARSSLHLAIYDFRLVEAAPRPVVAALRDRAAAGVDVRIASDPGKPHASFPQNGPPPAQDLLHAADLRRHMLGALADVLEHGRLQEFGGLYDRTQMDSVLQQWQGTPGEWKAPVFERVGPRVAGSSGLSCHVAQSTQQPGQGRPDRLMGGLSRVGRVGRGVGVRWDDKVPPSSGTTHG